MLHLIIKAIPAPLHRAVMPYAHKVRHYWRRWRGKPIQGAAIILTNPAGEVLLLRHSYGPPVWALPGGGIGAREDPAAAARRELAEELQISPTSMQSLGTVEEVISSSHHIGHLFAATTDQTPKPDGREVVEASFFAADALPDNTGRISLSRIAAWRERTASL
ncbi:NUDIX domain-containing protein [Erythrobacter sp. YT30]|uniref:NUDIX domain-containing protein n=1 Tax=Erythrobacter sp. YT30 TaxID=1735012 RepID=UPI00076DB6D3|nr:NUDIX domain-containing protein [Erythrobacter sp. YT30]KWV91937.1 DNA mismatch repair protein MutT [Erythrobacter sp. YT30]